ncbi:MAG: hypothetical protein ABWU16_00070 [Halothiobacillaceae bacterium]
MNDRHPAISIVVEGRKCLATDGAETASGCPELLSTLGIAIVRHAAKLAHFCNLGTLSSIELQTRAGLPVYIEPAAGKGPGAEHVPGHSPPAPT